MTSIKYPSRNSVITFLEPFPRKEWSRSILKYYILASINSKPPETIRIVAQQQKDIIDNLIHIDLKLTNSIVRCDSHGKFTILQHSTQSDFSI